MQAQLPEIRRQIELQNFSIAEGLCRELLQADPSNDQAWEILGEIALYYGQLDAAIECLNRALIIAPNNFECREKLARALLQGQNTKDALSHLKKLHEKTRQPHIAVLLAQTHWRRGSYTIAKKLFHEAVSNDPTNPDYAVRAAQAYMHLGDFDQAIEYLAKFSTQPDRYPVAAGLRAIFTFDDQLLSDSLDSFHRACVPDNALPDAVLAYAFALQMANREPEANSLLARIPDVPRFQALKESFEIKQQHWPQTRVYGQPLNVLLDGIQAMPEKGMVLEFGVFHGRSINIIAPYTKRVVHGFDSFEGLPEDWMPDEPRGSYSTEGIIPTVPANVELHHGWFEKTLAEFLSETDEPAAFIHIDCDIYSSTVTVLELLAPRIQPGTIIVLDDYIGYPEFREHEFRAFNEFLENTNTRCEYLSFSLMGREAAVRIL